MPDTLVISSIEENNPFWARSSTILFALLSPIPGKVFEITKEVLKQILEYDGPVFGASAIECGHYENLSLDEAKKECRAYLKVLESQTNMEFTYPQ